MTNRERAMAILNYQPYDKMPVVSFGYWYETLEKWASEGHFPMELVYSWGPVFNEADDIIAAKLGFDFKWHSRCESGYGLYPEMKTILLEEREDGTYLERDHYGVTVMRKRGTPSIPSELEHSLTNRESWEKDFKHRFKFCKERIPDTSWLKNYENDAPLGLSAGSLFGVLRDIIGVVNISYMYADDEELFAEIINDSGNLAYDCVKAVLEQGIKYDYIHFWEDICFKNGPLVNPTVFNQYVAPHYKRITGLCNDFGINIFSLDCDGCIDALVPIWLNNGVNTMFPIEVGTWNASIAPWREKYGKELRGVGGMDKKVFSLDYKAVDAEIERLRPLIELGGYIPCPDHLIAPDAIWENVQYYCDKMQNLKI